MTCFKAANRFRIVTTLMRIVIALIFVAFAFPASDANAAKKPKPKTQIKFATLAPDGSTWMKVMRAFDTELREQTENRVGFKFYPGGVQGDEEVVLRKIRNGQLHGGGFTGFGLGSVSKDFRAMEVPFMFHSIDEVDHVRGELDAFFKDMYEKKGFALLGWADVGFVYLFSNRPIRNPDELRAGKVWTWSGDKLAELFFKAFDVSPIPLALPDVLTSLQMGVVAAVYAPPLACIALQWFTRVKYMSDIPVTYGFGAMLVSERMVKKLEPGDVAIMKQLADKHSRVLIRRTRRQDGEALDLIKKEGVEILEIDAAVSRDFFHTGRIAWGDGVGKLYSQEPLELVSAKVEEYRQTQNEARK
jgi:TRAP-type C4-dicarboxylate transport system substrate-binding protein